MRRTDAADRRTLHRDGDGRGRGHRDGRKLPRERGGAAPVSSRHARFPGRGACDGRCRDVRHGRLFRDSGRSGTGAAGLAEQRRIGRALHLSHRADDNRAHRKARGGGSAGTCGRGGGNRPRNSARIGLRDPEHAGAAGRTDSDGSGMDRHRKALYTRRHRHRRGRRTAARHVELSGDRHSPQT